MYCYTCSACKVYVYIYTFIYIYIYIYCMCTYLHITTLGILSWMASKEHQRQTRHSNIHVTRQMRLPLLPPGIARVCLCYVQPRLPPTETTKSGKVLGLARPYCLYLAQTNVPKWHLDKWNRRLKPVQPWLFHLEPRYPGGRSLRG